MKATKYISLAALALMGTLASCQSDDEAADLNARPADAVSVNFSVGSLQATTRSNAVATDEAQYQFNAADQVCVNTAGQDPVTYQYDGTKWNEATAGKFLVWTADQQNFQAYYPANVAGTSMTTFTLPADQSSVEKINAADYMTGQQNVSKGNEVQMTLNRKMARVIVRISGFGSQYFDDQKTVSNVRIYSEASGIADGNPTGSSTEIQPYAQGNGGQGSTYTALVVPGYGDSGARFIQLTDGEGSTLRVKGIPEMEAGNSYTFNLVVGKNRIEVASVTVQDWATGETLTGGQAEEELAVPVTSITLNKTATTIPAGQTETISVTAVAPDNATDKTYTWKTSDESIATVDQDGKVTAVAAGTVTIYAEANDGSGVKGNCTVTVTPATITVTWNNNDITGTYGSSFTKDGVTITAGFIDFDDKNFMEGGTFSTTLGNFTKIVVTTGYWDASGTGWSGSGQSGTWTGNASSVSFSGEIMGMGMGNTKLVFTIQPTN